MGKWAYSGLSVCQTVWVVYCLSRWLVLRHDRGLHHHILLLSNLLPFSDANNTSLFIWFLLIQLWLGGDPGATLPWAHVCELDHWRVRLGSSPRSSRPPGRRQPVVGAVWPPKWPLLLLQLDWAPHRLASTPGSRYSPPLPAPGHEEMHWGQAGCRGRGQAPPRDHGEYQQRREPRALHPSARAGRRYPCPQRTGEQRRGCQPRAGASTGQQIAGRRKQQRTQHRWQ